MASWITEAVRSLLWAFCELFLRLMDAVYFVLKEVVLLDFTQFDFVWRMWQGVLCFLALFVMIRFSNYGIEAMMDDEAKLKFKFSEVIFRLGLVTVLVAILPLMIQGVSSFGTWATANAENFLGISSSSQPSTMILSANAGIDNGYWDENGSWISNGTVTIKLEDVDINASDPSGKNEYLLFSGYDDILLVMLVSIAASMLIVLIAVQVVMRQFELVAYILVLPYPIAELIKDTEGMKNWMKAVAAIYSTNFFQMALLITTLLLCGSSYILDSDYSIWIQMIVLIGGFLFAYSGVPALARFIGGDTGSSNILQQVMALKMGADAVKKGIGAAGKTAMSLGKEAGNQALTLGSYGIGRSLGGKSVTELSKERAEKSFSTIGNQNNNMVRQREKTAEKDSGHSAHHLDNAASGNNEKEIRLSKKGSKAEAMAESAYRMSGLKGYAARGAVSLGGHLYQRSLNQIGNSKHYKISEAIKKNTGPKIINRNGGKKNE